MPINRFKLRNFGSHREPFVDITSFELDYSFSNSLFDSNKGVTHDFIHSCKNSDDDHVRIVSDVEIIMSNDDCVSSLYSPEYRQKLLNSLQGLRTVTSSPPRSDDELLNSTSVNCLELDERVSVTKSLADCLTKFNSNLSGDALHEREQPSEISGNSSETLKES